MPGESNIYVGLWKKYKPAIVALMKSAIDSSQYYQLSGHEFEALGNRESAGYSFRLEVRNGKALNNIGGSAVARDLLIVLKESATANQLWNDRTYIFQNSRNFVLSISASNS